MIEKPEVLGHDGGEVVRFRPNVAALVTRSDGHLLICERWMVPGAWQFPQGGVDDGESMIEALHREVEEEIGLTPKDYKVVDQREGYRYLYPENVRKKKVRKHGCQGQEQMYFLCKISSDDAPIDVSREPREFAGYRWIKPEEFQLEWLPEFKHEVYRDVMKDFFGVTI
ncbi:MAG: RNA pyrophosphohydrolase [Verrucomicrobiota bacterium]